MNKFYFSRVITLSFAALIISCNSVEDLESPATPPQSDNQIVENISNALQASRGWRSDDSIYNKLAGFDGFGYALTLSDDTLDSLYTSYDIEHYIKQRDFSTDAWLDRVFTVVSEEEFAYANQFQSDYAEIGGHNEMMVQNKMSLAPTQATKKWVASIAAQYDYMVGEETAVHLMNDTHFCLLMLRTHSGGIVFDVLTDAVDYFTGDTVSLILDGSKTVYDIVEAMVKYRRCLRYGIWG